MKHLRLVALLLASVAGTAFADHSHNHSHGHGEAMHGGVVAAAKDVDFELVASSDSIQLHLRNHGTPIDVSKASARLTILAGSDKQEVELKPAGGLLEAKGSFKVAGAKVIAVVTLPGKTQATVRFSLR